MNRHSWPVAVALILAFVAALAALTVLGDGAVQALVDALADIPEGN